MNIQISQVLARWILGQSNILDYPKLDRLLSLAAEHGGTEKREQAGCEVSFNCVERKCCLPENIVRQSYRSLLSKNKRQSYRIKRILKQSSSVKSYIENPCCIEIKLPNHQKVKLKPDFLVVTKPNSVVFLQIDKEPLSTLPEGAQQALNNIGCRYLMIHPRQIIT